MSFKAFSLLFCFALLLSDVHAHPLEDPSYTSGTMEDFGAEDPSNSSEYPDSVYDHCHGINCDWPVCLGEAIPVTQPGDCCPSCPVSTDPCAEIFCDWPYCADGATPVTPPGACCPSCPETDTSEWDSWNSWNSWYNLHGGKGGDTHGMTGAEGPVIDVAKVERSFEGLMRNIEERIRRRLDVVAPALEEINTVHWDLKAIEESLHASKLPVDPYDSYHPVDPVVTDKPDYPAGPGYNICDSNPCPVGELCYESTTESKGYFCSWPHNPSVPANNICDSNPCPVGELCHEAITESKGFYCSRPHNPSVPAYNSCDPNPCPVGLLCYESITGGISCSWPAGPAGPAVPVGPAEPAVPAVPAVSAVPAVPERNLCDSNPCQNGAKCYEIETERLGFVCDCREATPQNFYGDFCQNDFQEAGVRFVDFDGPNAHYGHLQILDGEWGSICADDLDETSEALIVAKACAAFGKTAKVGAPFYDSTDDVMWTSMDCSGLPAGDDSIHACKKVPGKDCKGRTVTGYCKESHDYYPYGYDDYNYDNYYNH